MASDLQRVKSLRGDAAQVLPAFISLTIKSMYFPFTCTRFNFAFNRFAACSSLPGHHSLTVLVPRTVILLRCLRFDSTGAACGALHCV